MDARLQIQATPYAGNGVFAVSRIPRDTLVLTTQFPHFSVIYRAYRKETCGFCFKYNLGRHWKIRSSATGFVFCAEACRLAWEADVGTLGVLAYEKVEELVRGFRGPQEQAAGHEEVPPSDGEIRQAWADAEPIADRILEMRKKNAGRLKMPKPITMAPDTLAFALSGVLALYKVRESGHVSGLDILYEAPAPYTLHRDLLAHVASYLQLLEVLPAPLLDLVTPRNVQRIAGLAYDNAFGIRSVDHEPGLDAPMYEDPGSELLGWSLYPEASLFNHSCLPNVRKARDGRVWRFWTSHDVEVGEQVCITYLGGDEASLERDGRQERLKLGWEFDCACRGCL